MNVLNLHTTALVCDLVAAISQAKRDSAREDEVLIDDTVKALKQELHSYLPIELKRAEHRLEKRRQILKEKMDRMIAITELEDVAKKIGEAVKRYPDAEKEVGVADGEIVLEENKKRKRDEAATLDELLEELDALRKKLKQ